MIPLIIIGSILLVLVLISLINVDLNISCSNDSFRVYLKALFIKFNVYSSEDETPKHKQMSYKKYKKLIAKKDSKKTKDKKKLSKSSLEEKIRVVINIVKKASSTFKKHIKLKIYKVYVVVSEEDASKTALTYGLVSQLIAYLTEIASNIIHVKTYKQSIICEANFISQKSEFDINVCLSLRLFFAIILFFKAGIMYIKNTDK